MVKELLTNKHKLYRIAFPDSSVDRQWDTVISSDESTFSSANGGMVLVYRERGQCYRLRTCLYPHALVVYLFTFGAESPKQGLACSTIYVTWTLFSTFFKKYWCPLLTTIGVGKITFSADSKPHASKN